MKMMMEFPLEITAEILSRLPANSIVECKRVCKTWRTLINNDFGFLFGEQPFSFLILTSHQLLCYVEYYYHTMSTTDNNTIIDHGKEKEKEENDKKELAVDHLKVTTYFKLPPPPLPEEEEEEQGESRWAILGSSNGLICLSVCRFHGLEEGFFTYNPITREFVRAYVYNIYVYNPMTSEFVDVGAEIHISAGGGFRASGFGYHPSTKEYKVVRINYETEFSRSGQVKVYTLGSGTASGWRDKGEIPYVITGVRKPGVLVNGALYWITLDEKILSFDLAEEEFRIVPKPRQLNLRKTSGLGVLRGCLCVGTTKYNGCTNLWVMNNNKLYMSSSTSNTTTDDVEQSWVRLPIAFYKSPLRYDINDWVFNEISSYGLKFQCFGRFNCNSRLDIIPYAKSFVSLKALGEENTLIFLKTVLARQAST